MKRHSDANTEKNVYYLRVSRKIRNIKYISLLFMVVSAFLILWAYKENMTYGNLRYLLRDIDEAGTAATVTDTVYYAADEKNTFAYYRDDLAVGSTSGITFHRAFGSRSFADEVNFKAPVLAVSDKYLLAADIGGHHFYVYNSLGRVYDEKTENEIISIASADNGGFAVAVKNKKGGADISVYDRNFKKTALLTRVGDVYSIGFLSNGELYICESDVENASLCTDISLYKDGAAETFGSVRESGIVFGIKSVKGGYFVLTNRAVSLYSGGEKVKTKSFGTSSPLFADFTKDGLAILLKENSSGEGYGVYRFASEGEDEYYKVQKGAKGIAVCGKKICVLYEGYVFVCSGDENSEIEIPYGARDILPKDNGSIIVCYNDYAKILTVK